MIIIALLGKACSVRQSRVVSRLFRGTTFLFIGVLLMASCARAPEATPTAIPSRTRFSCTQPGNVQTLAVDSFGDIGLYLPPCYVGEVGSRYPVLYLLPGFGGTHMSWFDTGLAPLTDGLIQSNEIPPFLIVTTDDTYEGVNPADIIDMLLPYIDSHYRTLPDRLHRAIAGGSLGGASAYILTFQHPDLFSDAGVFGNGLITGQDSQLEDWLKGVPEGLKPRVFLNSGEQDTWMLQQAKALIPYLDKYGIEHTEIFSTGGHSGSYWLSNFPAYYQWLAEDW